MLSTLSWSNPSELTFAIQRYSAIAGRKILVVTSGTKALELANKCKKIDPALDFFIQPIPVFGDTKREIKKARTSYGAKCALHLKIEKQSWRLQPYGICYDPNRKLSVVEEGDTWNIIDNKKRPARAIDYAVLTQDNILMEILKNEEKQSFQMSRRLQIGAGAIAASAAVPLLMMSDSDIAKNEDRIWTALFLLGSAGIVYQSSKVPAQIKSTKNISNYFPKSMVKAKIEETWPTPKEEPPVDTVETTNEDDGKPSEDAEQKTGENASKTTDETESPKEENSNPPASPTEQPDTETPKPPESPVENP